MLLMKYFLLFLVSSTIFSQEKLISGYVFFKDYHEVEGIYITNKSNKISVLTNKVGTFNLKISIGDTISVEHSTIFNKNFVVDASVWKDEKLRIYLEPYYVKLEEVVIKPKLTGIIAIDVANRKETPQEILEKSIGLPNYKGKQRKISYDPIQIGGLMLPVPNIDAIYDILSGEREKREALYRYEDKQEIIKEIRAYYGDKFFINDLKIPEEEINFYIEYVYEISPIQHLFRKRDYFKIITELENKRFVYLERLKSRKKN